MKDYIVIMMPVLLFLFLILASIFDLFNDKEVPISIGICGILIRMIELFFFEKGNISYYLIMAVIVFLCFLTGAALGAIGGADCIYASMICFYIGEYGLYVIVLAFILTLPVALYIKKKNKAEKKNLEFPFSPYLLLSTSIITLYLLIGGFFYC